MVASSTHMRLSIRRRLLLLLIAAVCLLAACAAAAQEAQHCSVAAASGDSECAAASSDASQQQLKQQLEVDGSALDAVEAELQSLEELIALQQRKALLLREARRKIMMGERLTALPGSTIPTSHSESFDESRLRLQSSLSRRIALHSDATIVWSGVLPFRSRAGKQKLGTMPLYGLISEQGAIVIHDPFGDHILTQSLGHDAPIACAKFDGSDAMNPVLMTADTNSHVRVHSFALKKGGQLVSGRSNLTETAIEQDTQGGKDRTFSMSMFQLAAFELGAAPSACGSFYSRNTGHTLLIGDQAGILHSYTRNGTALATVPLSQKPVTAVARGSQFLASASDNAIHLFSLPAMKPLKYQCRGLQAQVRALEFDAGAPMFLYAGTEAGTLAVFNVRSKNELFPCELIDTTAIGDKPVASVATTRGYALAASSCTIAVFNSTTAKHRSLTLVERLDLRTEGCSHAAAVSGSFVQGARPSDVTFLMRATPQHAIVFDSKLENSTESNFNITSLRLPVLAIAALLVFAFQYFKRPKPSRLTSLDGIDAFSRMANRQRRATGRRGAGAAADAAALSDDGDVADSDAFIGGGAAVQRSNHLSEPRSRIDRLDAGLSPSADS